MPPARRTDENRIVFRNRFLIKQVRHSGTQVVVGFTLDAVAVIIRICGIRFDSLNPMDVSTRKFHDAFRYGPGVPLGGKVNHKHIAVPGRSIGFIRISRIFNFTSDKPSKFGTPTVAYCADQLHLSANYFGDLIKKETGLSAQEYILAKTMDTAKELLADPTKSVSDVAYALGYQYPQYFSKAFKRVVGCSPNEYRNLN